jgi:CHAD domain-containing protein
MFRIKPSRDRRLVKFAERAVEDARRNVERHQYAALDDAEGLHELRIACKRLRYTAETFASVLPPALVGLAHTASRFQGRLGDVHDADMALVRVRHAPGLPDADRAWHLAEVGRLREERIADFQELRGAASATLMLAS